MKKAKLNEAQSGTSNASTPAKISRKKSNLSTTAAASSKRQPTVSNSSATTISTIDTHLHPLHTHTHNAHLAAGTNTDDTDNDAESVASSVPPCLIDGMSKFFTPTSRQRKHSNEHSDTSVSSLLKAASSKLNKSFESTKSDASTASGSTKTLGKKSKAAFDTAKKSAMVASTLAIDSAHAAVDKSSHVNANLNNSDKENQSNKQQHAAVSELVNEQVDATVAASSTSGKSSAATQRKKSKAASSANGGTLVGEKNDKNIGQDSIRSTSGRRFFFVFLFFLQDWICLKSAY